MGIALALVLAALAAVPSPPSSARAAVRAFEQAWRQGLTPVILERLDALAAHDDPLVVDALLGVFTERAIPLYARARDILAGLTEARSLEHLLEAGLDHHDEVVREQVLVALGLGRPAGLDWVAVVEGALDDRVPRVRAAAVRALGQARADGRLSRIVDLADDESVRVRMEVPGALVRLAGERALPLVEALARDRRWRVRLAVAEALAALKTPEATRRLAVMLRDEHGRLREDVVAHLRRLTGRAYGADARVWLAFLDDAETDYLAEADRRRVEGRGTRRYAGGIVYHSVGSTSRRFVFLTDVSGSMDTPARVRETGEVLPRIELARRELVGLVRELEPDVFFNLVTFESEQRFWRERPARATRTTRATAERVVAGYRAGGGTNLFAPLERLFDDVESTLDNSYDLDHDFDTLFVLSDGDPSEGRIRDTELLEAYVVERARALRLRIHCVALTEEPDAARFLERIAAATGGRLVHPVTSPH